MLHQDRLLFPPPPRGCCVGLCVCWAVVAGGGLVLVVILVGGGGAHCGGNFLGRLAVAWKVMPMGVTNGNSSFRGITEWILRNDRDIADPFVDNVIVGFDGATWEEAVENDNRDLHQILDRFREYSLTCSFGKANFFVDEVEFAVNVVGHGKRWPMKRKISYLEKWDRPVTVTELRALFGFCN